MCRVVDCFDAQVDEDGNLDHPLQQEFWCDVCPENYVDEGNRQVCAGTSNIVDPR